MSLVSNLKQRIGDGAVMAYRAFLGERDAVRLRLDVPRLRALRPHLERARQRLGPFHQAYTAEISTYNMAASLELAAFLYAYCELIQPAVAVDLGSGFSSFVFRHYAAHAGQPMQVWSVDDDPAWLEKTRTYLSQHHLPTTHLVAWGDFLAMPRPQFDLVLNDLNRPQARQQMIGPALDLLRPGGVIIFDDIHKPHYRVAVRRAVHGRGFRYYSLQHFTRDAIRRFAGLAIASRARTRPGGGADSSGL